MQESFWWWSKTVQPSLARIGFGIGALAETRESQFGKAIHFDIHSCPEAETMEWNMFILMALYPGGAFFQDTGNRVEMAKGVFLVSTSNLLQTSNSKVT
jgi:hypothetical protein